MRFLREYWVYIVVPLAILAALLLALLAFGGDAASPGGYEL